MTIIDILVPDLPESVANATIVLWHKKPGDYIKRDEILVEIETDKIVLEIQSPKTGILNKIIKDKGSNIISKEVIGKLKYETNHCSSIIEKNNKKEKINIQHGKLNQKKKINDIMSPTIRRIIAENNFDKNDIKESIIRCINKKDIENYISNKKNIKTKNENRTENRKPMTRLRKRIAERLLETKKNTAMLTTFNEVNMQSIIDLRNKYGKIFEMNHNVKLGFMSFFVKAVLLSLKKIPEINSYIDGENIVYRNYFDINIAVSTSRGLVTPIIKNIDKLSIPQIEHKIKELATKSRDGKLTIEELISGNFTITNGGIFGSLMSTPIINPPQSAILGMHTIKNRPIEYNGKIVIMPMMYLALSYDHRLIDGKESTKFLISIKEIIENPIVIMLDL